MIAIGVGVISGFPYTLLGLELYDFCRQLFEGECPEPKSIAKCLVRQHLCSLIF